MTANANTTTPLHKSRYAAAEAALEAFVFDDEWLGSPIEQLPSLAGFWVIEEDKWRRTVFVRLEDQREDEPTKLSFKVTFPAGSSDPRLVYATDDEGESRGYPIGDEGELGTALAQDLAGSKGAKPFLYDESFEDGKYTVRQHADGKLEALHYGEPWPWRDLDKLIGAMLGEVERLRLENARLQALVDNAEPQPAEAPRA